MLREVVFVLVIKIYSAHNTQVIALIVLSLVDAVWHNVDMC